MSNALTDTNLVVHEKALEAAGVAITLVMRVPAPLKSIADQVIRSASFGYWRAERAVTPHRQRAVDGCPPPTLPSQPSPANRCRRRVPANLAEGHGRAGRDRVHLWRIAYASAKEVDSHLRLLAQAGVVDGRKTEKALATFDEVRAMTWRLLNPGN